MSNMGDPTRTTPSYGDSDGFESASGYHGSEMPMMHLQGGMGPVFEQAPMDVSMNYMNDRPQSGTDMIAWDSTSLATGAYAGGDQEIRSTDSNGYRTPPKQGPTSA